MNKPVLTIGIPTYNRPNSISKTVRALLPQLNEQIVLKVWDNCSDTPVSELFTDEEKKNFTIIRNKVNIGGDANICGVIYHADTKWVWDLGDDDGPLPDAVETILNFIEKYPNALLFKFNSYIEKDLHSFEDLTSFCKYPSIFSNFLYISSGIYNREKLMGDIQHYYVNLSSMVGQTIFVLKHLENQNEDCYFFVRKIVQHSVGILDNNEEEAEGGTWNALTFISRSSLIFDVFNKKRRSLNGTLFSGVANLYLDSLGGHGLSLRKTLLALRIAIRNVGFSNIMKYNRQVFLKMAIKIILVTILPTKHYEKIKNRAKAKVNKKMLSSATEQINKTM